MASIRTGIELQDNFSSVLDNITASVSSAISEMEQMQHTMDAGLDTSAITDATDEIDAATAAARELTEALQDIHAPIINREPPIEPHPAPAAQEEVTPQVLANPPPTPDEITVPVVPEISDIPEPDTSGVRDYTNLINLSENALQKIVDVQNRINNQSSATNLLPDGVENQINNVNAEIQRMQAALNYLRENPIDLGAEVTLLQLDQLNGASQT